MSETYIGISYIAIDGEKWRLLKLRFNLGIDVEALVSW